MVLKLTTGVGAGHEALANRLNARVIKHLHSDTYGRPR
jgi:hypothetical protein